MFPVGIEPAGSHPGAVDCARAQAADAYGFYRNFANALEENLGRKDLAGMTAIILLIEDLFLNLNGRQIPVDRRFVSTLFAAQDYARTYLAVLVPDHVFDQVPF